MTEHRVDRNAFNAAKVRWYEALLEEHGVLDKGEVDEFLTAYLAQSNPRNGARIVARAWVDPGFRARLLADAPAAVAELSLVSPDEAVSAEKHLTVVPNSREHHNMVVCTLCSCYPIALLGPSPSWYKSPWYRAESVRNPRAVLKEFGLELAPNVEVTVWDSSAEMRYMVLPERPNHTEALSEADLADLVTRNGLIGVAAV